MIPNQRLLLYEPMASHTGHYTDSSRVSAGEIVHLEIGTWPIEPRQRVWVEFEMEPAIGAVQTGRVEAAWRTNRGVNSYWEATFGPFQRGDRVRYTIFGSSLAGEVFRLAEEFQVGPKLHLAIIWHQHQPIYKDGNSGGQTGGYLQPWVRLHCLRDYYAMANLVRQHSSVHLTINLTPALLWQIQDYVDGGATDRALDLTLKPSGRLSKAEREYVLANFFDGHWHNQIFPHPRYKELFEKRYRELSFTTEDIRDLQMWFNLAWFAKEFREGDVRLVTGETVSIEKFIEQGRNFSARQIEEMVQCQYKIMRAVLPIHRQMQDEGQIEVSTTPFFHPILPLLVDTDRATMDRPGATYPLRYSWPEDADAQIKLAINAYTEWFGRPPQGMWPAEGAVGQSVIPLFARNEINWIASDEGVLARSGRYGYRTDEPDVLCQPYRAEEGEYKTSILFRSQSLSDDIGFHYYRYADYHQAAADFLDKTRKQYAAQLQGDADRLLTVILDGENAWGDYREDARPFLEALYSQLEDAADIQCVTPAEYLRDHPIDHHPKVYELFTGSWIDQWGSPPGVDLNTWIGDEEKNKAWSMLGSVRQTVSQNLHSAGDLSALRSIYMAEGSDWFWWFGSDHQSGNDELFDDLFRAHLKNAFKAMKMRAPSSIDDHIMPHSITWTFANQVKQMRRGDRLSVVTNCPGILTWSLDDLQETSHALDLVGGAMAGLQQYHLRLGPFSDDSKQLSFRFRCTHDKCDCREICCEERILMIQILADAGS